MLKFTKKQNFPEIFVLPKYFQYLDYFLINKSSSENFKVKIPTTESADIPTKFPPFPKYCS